MKLANPNDAMQMHFVPHFNSFAIYELLRWILRLKRCAPPVEFNNDVLWSDSHWHKHTLVLTLSNWFCFWCYLNVIFEHFLLLFLNTHTHTHWFRSFYIFCRWCALKFCAKSQQNVHILMKIACWFILMTQKK